MIYIIFYMFEPLVASFDKEMIEEYARLERERVRAENKKYGRNQEPPEHPDYCEDAGVYIYEVPML